MLRDVKSNYTIGANIAADDRAAGTVNGATVDHALGNSCSYFVTAGTFGASATLDVKLQYSADGSSWTDEDGATGNDTAITQLTATGTAQLNIINPQARYSRAVATSAVQTVGYGVVSVLGPLRSIVPTDA